MPKSRSRKKAKVPAQITKQKSWWQRNKKDVKTGVESGLTAGCLSHLFSFGFVVTLGAVVWGLS